MEGDGQFFVTPQEEGLVASQVVVSMVASGMGTVGSVMMEAILWTMEDEMALIITTMNLQILRRRL